MPNINFPFVTPANYTFGATEIDVSANAARLALVSSGGLIINEDFTDDVGFTYDNTKAEFVAGVVQQKDITPVNSLFAVSYDINANPITVEADLNWHKAGGSLTATLNGLPVIVGNELVCTGTQGVYYTRNSLTTETHKFKFTPNYSTSPPTNINLVSGWNGSNNDRFTLTHSPSGNNLRFTVNNNIGTAILVVGTAFPGSWEPTASQKYEFELVLDSVLGTVRVFIDGVLHGTLSPGVWTRSTNSMRYYMGAVPFVYDQAEGSFDDYIMFSGAQHTAGYTPGYTIDPFIYITSQVDLPAFVGSGIGSIISLDGFVTIETGAPRYTAQIDGGGYMYWTGVAWATSDGTYSQANTAADFNTNIPTFPGSVGAISGSIRIHFTAINTQSNVDDLTVLHTANVAYNVTNPKIIPITTTNLDAITSFVATMNIVGLDDIRFTLQYEGQEKYWNGLWWNDSNGTYAETNNLATMQANISSWTFKGLVTPVVYLHSQDGITTPDIDDLTIGFNPYGGLAIAEGLSTVYIYVYNGENNPREGVVVQVQPTGYGDAGDKLINLTTVTGVTDSSGYVEFTLIETDSITDPLFGYEITIKAEDGNNVDKVFNKHVPIATVANILDLPDV